MAVQSTAMAVQNLLLAAHAEGLGACWMCAPLFCPEVVRSVLAFPAYWQPQGLITLGWPADGGRERQRRVLGLLPPRQQRCNGPVRSHTCRDQGHCPAEAGAVRAHRVHSGAASSVCSLPPCGGGLGEGGWCVWVSEARDPHPRPLPTRGRGVDRVCGKFVHHYPQETCSGGHRA
jgi:hypothetical protein